jgi:hypothetical protein
MENRYLNKNPIDWLLEETDPSIRYLTRKEILVDGDYYNSYDTLLESNDIRMLLKDNTDILGNTKHFDLFYKGTMWYFAEAVERGLDKQTNAIKKTAEFIIHRCQTNTGGFTLNWHPPVPVACRTGDMIKFLLRAGLNDENIGKGITWIADHQRHDGGWLHCPLAGICDQLKLILFNRPGDGLKREQNPNVASCFYATIACSMALIEYKQITGFNRYDHHILKAANFFLKRSLFKTGMNTAIKPGESWNTDFRLLGYPVLSQYDILYGLIFIAKAGFINDNRTGEAFNIIMSKQNNDGSWNLENAQTGMLYGNVRRNFVGKKNKWVTLNVLRLLKYAGT